MCGEEFVDPYRRLLISQIVFWVGAFFVGMILIVEVLQKMPPKFQQLGILVYLIVFPIIGAIFIGRMVRAEKKSSELDKATPNDRYHFKDNHRTKED